MDGAGSSKGSQSGSKRKMEFDLNREFFKKVAPSLTCHFCKIVPKQGPLYISKNADEGDKRIACQDCKFEKLPQSVPMPCTENILEALPLAACRYRKNNCQIVQDPKNISYHEEECNFRDVECIVRRCLEIVSVENITKHLFEEHSFNLKNTVIMESGQMTKAIEFDEKIFKVRRDGKPWRALKGPLLFNEKTFFIQSEVNPTKNYFQAWLQMYGSKFEAKNFKYSLQLEEKDDLGSPSYNGPMKSLDDRKTEVFESKTGLVVMLDVIRKYIDDDDKIHLEIKIEDLKPKDDEMDSQVSNESE